MTNIKHNLLENFISLGALQIVSYVIPLISLPYLSRVLSVDKFGLVFFAFAFMQYFIILTDYGFGLSATREIAVNRHNKNNLSNIFSAVTCAKILLLILSFILLCIMLLFIPKLQENSVVFLLSFFMVVGNALYPVWFFQGMERMKYITFLNILAKTIFLILIFIFVKSENDYIIVPLLNSIGFIVSGIIGMYFAINKLGAKLYIPKWSAIKKQLAYSSEFFLSRVSVSAYTNTNTFCLGLIGSNIMVGYYVAAEKIYQAMNGIQQPLNQALYPFVAMHKDLKTYKKLFTIAVLCNVLICTIVFLFSKEFITIFYGLDMVEAHKILKIFSIIVLFTFPSMLLGYPLLGALGHTKEANRSVIIGSIIHIIGLLILYFSKHMNVYSIVLMVLITEIIVFYIRAYSVYKYKLLKKEEAV